MPRAPRLNQHELDDEFEKFLKESLSDADDSMNAGKLRKFFDPHKREEEKQRKKESQPWWMGEDDGGPGGGGNKSDKFKKQTPTTNKWLKPKKQSTPVIAEDDEEEEEEIEAVTKAKDAPKPASRDNFSKDKDSRTLKPSISRDSLDETPSPRSKQSHDYDDEDDDFESDSNRSGVHPAKASFEDTLSYTGPSDGTTLGSTGPGAETMEEMADKERFFKELENKEGGRLDFRRLNQEADLTTGTIGGTMGGTLGGTMGGTMGGTLGSSLSSPYMGTADEHSSPIPLKKHIVASSRDTSEIESKSKEESSSHETPTTAKDAKKPSMLSKVALLETGDSTMNFTRPAKDVSPKKGKGDAKLLTTSNQGLSVTGTADDLEALHAAFRDAANTPTMGLDDSSYGLLHSATQPKPEPKPLEAQPRTVEDIIREIEEERKRKKQKEKEEMNRKKEEEEERRKEEEERRRKEEESNAVADTYDRGLDQVDGEHTSYHEDIRPNDQEPRGLDLSPANTQEVKGLNILPSDEGRGFDLQPANEGRGFDLQPSNEGRGFDLQPSNEGRGFDLQPTNEGRGFDLQPSNDGRGFELQPFSADDEASHGISSSTPSVKGKQKQSSKTRGRHGNIKSSGYGQPKPKVSSGWSPALAAKHKVKGSEIPIPGKKGKAGADRNLMQSVESFATYIQEHYADARRLTPPPEVRFSREEPILSAVTRESKVQHLTRERALVAEVTEWQTQWAEAHRLNAKLKAEMATHQREFGRKEEELRLLHEQELFKLKQDNFVLQAKLNNEEQQKKVKHKTLSGRTLEGASQEEIKLMQKEIIEQETLLQGYQQENERLYREVKKTQTANKDSEEILYKTNQKLQTELATLRELLEQRDVALRHKGIITGPQVQQQIAAGNTAVMGAGVIAELQAERQDDQIKLIEVKQQNRNLEQTKKELELHIEGVVRERKHAEDKLQNLREVKQREFQDMQEQYKREIEGFQKKLRWYAENQDMLDKDFQTLKEKDEDLRRLKETLEKVNKESGHKSKDAQRRAKERAADAKKIQDLERQVKEMNDIIRRRYPNSLPALIYAAASAPGSSSQESHPQPAAPKSHTVAFLVEKVKQMEEELAGKDDEVKRSLRVMEQKYNLMKFQYEDRLQNTEKQLKESTNKLRDTISSNRPHTNITALERELKTIKEKHKRKVQEMQTENDDLRKRLSKANSKGRRKSHEEDAGGIGINAGTMAGMEEAVAVQFQEKLSELSNELSAKDHEVEMLKGVCDRLMKEHFETQPVSEPNKHSASRRRYESTKKTGSSTKKHAGIEDVMVTSGKHYEPQNFAGSHISDVLLENEKLKQQMETISFEMEQQRLRVQATVAEAEGNARKTKEAAIEELSVVKARHVGEMDKVIAERALLHSDSQVARFTNQVESQKVLISHLQEQLSDARVDADTVAASHVREQVARTQLQQLRSDLEDAKKTHTPEMRHFEALQAKIAAMEARHSQREQELRHLVERAKHTATVEKDQQITICHQQLTKKNAEIQRFRAELDSILEILRELQRQGVVLPMHSHTVQSLL